MTLTNTGTALTGLTLTDDLGGYTAGGQTVYPPVSYTHLDVYKRQELQTANAAKGALQ